MRWMVLLLLAGGCNAVFGLSPTEPAPDALVLDVDEDGIEDAVDNCPSTRNEDQLDDDNDTVGDACDNCSLISNASQEALGDGDVMGDVCDPHPVTDGDCPILIETFADPATFDVNWATSSWIGAQQPSSTARVETAPGLVRLIPGQASSFVALLSRDLGGEPLTRSFDVQVLGDVDITVGSLSAYANLAPGNDPFGSRCGVKVGSGGVNYIVTEARAVNSYSTQQIPMSSESVGSKAFLRLSQPRLASDPVQNCRIDHGIAAQTLDLRVFVPPSTGAPAVVAETDTATVLGVLISVFQPGTPCPAPIRR